MAQFASSPDGQTERPLNVGILAMELYFPKMCISLDELEKEDDVRGRYTILYGQNGMAFCDDREDITSMLMTALKGLLDKYDIDPRTIGRLEVATDSLDLINNTESIRASLMALLAADGDVEGATTVSGAYGGIAALLNSVAWIGGSEWDGRFAVVVCGDISMHVQGSARATGGAGTVALLVGPDAPLALAPGRATHTDSSYRPAGVEDVPGQRWYLNALDRCWGRLQARLATRQVIPKAVGEGEEGEDSGAGVAAAAAEWDHLLLAAPYHALARRAFHLLDLRARPADYPPSLVAKWGRGGPSLEAALGEVGARAGEGAGAELGGDLGPAAARAWAERAGPGCLLAKELGHCGAAAPFLGLLALANALRGALAGRRVGLYATGGGAAALCFLRARPPPPGAAAAAPGGGGAAAFFTLERLADVADLWARLSARAYASPPTAALAAARGAREALLAPPPPPPGAQGKEEGKGGGGEEEDDAAPSPLQPRGDIGNLFPGTFYIESVDDRHVRTYAQL